MNLIKYFILSLSLLTLFSCQKETLYTKSGFTFGTSYHIQYFSKKEINLQKPLDSLFTLFNKTFSTYDSTSLISKINKSNKVSFKITSLFAKVFEASKNINLTTEGYFDPTIEPLINYWKSEKKSPKQFKKIKQSTGLNKSTLQGLTLTKHPKMQFSFNAIAKGYAVDLVHQMMEKRNIQNFLIEIGGEIAVKGRNKKSGNPWSVGIARPKLGSKGITLKIQLTNNAIATSGNYAKYWKDKHTGKIISHLVNPLSGLAEQRNIVSVSVISNTCMIADAYATAFMVMPIEKAKAISKKNQIPIYIIYLDKNGDTKEFISPLFKKYRGSLN